MIYYLVHSGVLKQKHGVRRYQYKDGSLTPLGREHYGVGPPRTKKEAQDAKARRDFVKKTAKNVKRMHASKVEKLTAANVKGLDILHKDFKEAADLSKVETEAFWKAYDNNSDTLELAEADPKWKQILEKKQKELGDSIWEDDHEVRSFFGNRKDVDAALEQYAQDYPESQIAKLMDEGRKLKEDYYATSKAASEAYDNALRKYEIKTMADIHGLNEVYLQSIISKAIRKQMKNF